MKTTILLTCLSIAIPASAQRNADIENIGPEEEIELGRSAADQLESNVTVLDSRLVDTFVQTDPEAGDTPVVVSDAVAITDYVDAVGQRLVASSDARVPFTFRVIEDASINGLALPGGFVYVNTGLLAAAGNEAELASALAHLIAHVTARHGVENYAQGRLLNILSIPLIFVGGAPSSSLARASSLAVSASMYSFSRRAVEEADFLGLQYLYTAGYDPQAAATFLETVQAGEADDDGQSPVFASHPPTAARIETIRRNIEEVLPPRDDNVVTTPEFDEMRMRLARR